MTNLKTALPAWAALLALQVWGLQHPPVTGSEPGLLQVPPQDFWIHVLLTLSLLVLMPLGYGLRSLLPSLALPLPQMGWIHGSLNAFGFGLCGLLAWRSHLRQPLEKPGPPAAFP